MAEATRPNSFPPSEGCLTPQQKQQCSQSTPKDYVEESLRIRANVYKASWKRAGITPSSNGDVRHATQSFHLPQDTRVRRSNRIDKNQDTRSAFHREPFEAGGILPETAVSSLGLLLRYPPTVEQNVCLEDTSSSSRVP